MANEITVTIADASLAEIWIAEALRAVYAKAVVARPEVILIKMLENGKKGDNLDFTEIGSLSVNNVGADGGITNQATTQTQRQVALSTWQECTWDVVDRVQLQSVLDHYKEFSVAAGQALAVAMDDAVLDDHGSFTGSNAIGSTTSPSQMSDDLALEAVVVLDNGNVPEDQRTWVFSPRAKADLLKLSKFSDAQATGFKKGSQLTNLFGELYGSPVVTTSRVITTGAPSVRKNLYLHREAIAMGIVRKINIEKLARVAKRTPYSADVLYGEAVIRSAFGVTINTLA